MAEPLVDSKVITGILFPLNKHHNRKSFDCGEPPLNDFLVKRALNSLLGRTYVLVNDPDASEIIAYITISPDVIAIQIGDGIPPIASVVKLEYLAVDTKYQNQGLGTDLIIFILRQVAHSTRALTSHFTLVAIEPLNEKARWWFLSRNFGFAATYLDKPCLTISVDTILSMDEPEPD